MQDGVLSELPKFKLETPPVGLAVDLEAAKTYLRVEDFVTEHNAYITSLIKAATEMAETFTRRKFLTQTWSIYWDGFPCDRRLEVPLVPFGTVSVFEYLDQATGNWTAVDASTYEVDNKSLVPALVLNSLVPQWPLTKYLAINSLHLRATCGYGTSTQVPDGIKMAILRMVSTWYDNSADVVQGQSVSSVPISANRLLMPYKVYSF